MTGVVYYESNDPHVHRWEDRAPEGLEFPVRLLTPIPDALFSNITRLSLFEIFWALRFGAAESWLAVRRSRKIDWSRCAMDNKCFLYD